MPSLVLWASLLCSCACRNNVSGQGQPRGAAASSKAVEAEYAPGFKRTAGGDAPRGTIAGDYRWAESAPTRSDAIARWRRFLEQHDPKDGEYEDGFHINHVHAARLELLRAYYLAGNAEAGDSLLPKIREGLPATR